MKNLRIKIYSLLFVLSVPTLTFAVSLADSTFKSLVYDVLNFINILVPILFALSFFVFFWGLSKFILHSDNQADVEKGKSYMFWGVIALFILISFRTIIGLIAGDLGFGNAQVAPQLPTDAVIPVTSGRCIGCAPN